MPVDLKTIASGYSTGLINENFQQIADLLNNNFLNRDGVEEGDANQMELDLDMNGFEILNVGYGSENGLVPKSYVDAGDAANSAEVAAEASARSAADESIRDLLQSYVDTLSDVDATLSTQLIQEIADRVAGDNQLRAEYSAADANLQAQLTGEVPLEASAFSPISWHSQTVDNSVTIPDNQNAWSFGPTMELGPGATVEVGTNSFWTIANGEVIS